ncbi:hypothetical protein FB567DRAFT_437077 [Paraphoma chrysanthemicola]|uniref:Zn(2)-C6 fungal-type domain-containing protein n=1 Tax=Paraphoma chrysanthemicola TaxID=798071 RepID=A0A8K0RBW2_9PLEO|nr:hypothetical protein FB567DRAFT_437077 [Paraphoma chrysanthemicola]
MATRFSFMDLSVDLKTLIVQHVTRPTDLRNICLACKQLHEIAVRQLYHEVTLDVGSPNDNRLGAFLNPKNIGLPHIRKLDLYLADVVDKCNQMQQANFAIRMILELLPENILDKFSWHPWSPFSGDNLVLLYKKQKRMKWMESIALDREVIDELQKLPDLDKVFENVRKIGLYPDSREVLDFCHFLLRNTAKRKLDKITLHASFDEIDPPVPERELHDSSTGPGLITSTMFSHMQPFSKCTPITLKEITLQKLKLRYAADNYCRLIDFRSVKSIRIFGCPGADALFAELSKSTKLPVKLETLEFKHEDNNENDGLGALDGFLCLVSGIKVLTLDLTFSKSLPSPTGIVRHGKTLKSLSIHASTGPDSCDEELVYDYASFSQICKDCSLLEQMSMAFPQVSVIQSKNDSFVHFENCLGDLPLLATLNITNWPNNSPSSTRLPRKIYEHLLANLAQQSFERSSSHAREQGRSSKLSIVAYGSSDKVYDREDSQNQIIFVKGKQVDPLGNEKSTALVDYHPQHRTTPSAMTAQQPIYPANPNAPLHDGAGPPRGPYYQEPPFPKVENLSDVLQAHALHANHALNDQRAPAQPPPTLAQTQTQTQQSSPQHQKPNRLRKACDSCSIRKCDETGPPCRACVSLEIPCTFDRPSRRRGPPNRHAEEIKKRRLNDSGPHSGQSSPQSPTNAAHALAQLQSSSHPQQLSAEAICPLPTMNALIDDFFMYIHPLCPFPHEPSFREAWERREDYTNPSFLALLASMIAALVASFPRKPRLHLKTQTRHEYPSHLSLVDKCREVCTQARGPGYLDRPSLNVYDACTSYFLGLTGAYVFQWRQLRLYFAECLTIIRSLGLHKSEAQGYTYLGSVPSAWGSNGPNYDGSREFKLDHITEQIGRRVFWTVFVGVRTIQQLGASFGELTIAPATPTEPLPPLPVEVDDVHIFPSEIQSQQAGVVSLMTGFNLNVRVYLSYSSLATAEMAFGIDEIFDWDRQQRIFEQSLQRCRTILDSIPEVLRVEAKPGRDGGFSQQRQPYYPPMPEFSSLRDPALTNYNGSQPLDTRRYEIQKANVYASHLCTRSYLVEKYFLQLEKFSKATNQAALRSSPIALATGLDRIIPPSTSANHAETLEKMMSDEREQVVKDLLVVLGSIDMVNMEPNGDSFVSLHVYLQDSDFLYEAGDEIAVSCPSKFIFRANSLSPIASLRFVPTQTQKIRSIASTLLEVPKERKGSVALQHQDYLYKFLDILSKLERVSPEASDPTSSSVDEETELRLWADLRDHQLKFQEQGGIYGFS